MRTKDKTPASPAHYRKLLKNKEWRLNNLYWIKDKNGKRVKFKLKKEQNYLRKFRHTRNIILKCRQLGMTTFIQIDYLDECLFVPNTNAGVIAHNLEDAMSFFKDKIKYAYDSLPKHIRDDHPARTDSARELRFDNGSMIRVGTSLRSGTYRRLHISELAKLCALFPERAREVRTGAMETVPLNGIIDIESTAEGAMGDFFEKCEVARKAKEEKIKLGPLDYKFFFFPWQDEPEYSLDATPIVTDVARQHFHMLVDRKIHLKDGQKAWWIAKKASLQGDMGREYPAYPQEAFETAVEGSYFGRQMEQIRAKGQIRNVPIERGVPIETFWDLGRDTTSIWFFQKVGFDFRFVDYFQNSGEDMAYYVNVLKTRTDAGEYYSYGDCYLPHDGNRKSLASDKTPADVLYANGFEVRIVERTNDKTLSIERARQTLPTCWFDRERCREGIACLDNYRKERDEKLNVWKKQPRHDAASHGADSFMTFSDGYVYTEELEEEESYTIAGRNATTGY